MYLYFLNFELKDSSEPSVLERLNILGLDSKIRVLESYLHELKKEKILSELSSSDYDYYNKDSVFNTAKRASIQKDVIYKKRMNGRNDKKRPGWELAYGKRK